MLNNYQVKNSRAVATTGHMTHAPYARKRRAMMTIAASGQALGMGSKGGCFLFTLHAPDDNRAVIISVDNQRHHHARLFCLADDPVAALDRAVGLPDVGRHVLLENGQH